MLVFVFAGCGRINFGTPDDGGAIVTCVPASETCNGVDDDCNDLVDEGCPCTPFNAAFMGDTFEADNDPVWTGSDYYVARRINAQYQLTQIAQTGALGSNVPFSSSGNPRVVWAGDRFIAVHVVSGEVRATMIALLGMQLGEMGFGPGGNPIIRRAEAGFDIAWTITGATEDVFYVQHVDKRLLAVGDRQTLVVGPTGTLRDHARSSTGIVMFVWSDGISTVHASLVDSTTPLVSQDGRDITVSANASGFSIATLDYSNTFRVYHADSTGSLDAGPNVIDTGTTTLNRILGASRGTTHVVIAQTQDTGGAHEDRYDFDDRATLVSSLRMYTPAPVTGMTLTGEHGGYADVERTALSWSYLSTTGYMFLDQSCP